MTNKLFDDELDDNEETITIPDDEPLKPFKEKYHDEKGIARALIEKENFIKQLKNETAGLRSELASRSKVEETVDRLLSMRTNESGSNSPAPTGGQPAQPNASETKQGLTLEEVEALLAKRQADAQAAQNLEITKQKLQETYGTEWQKVVAKKGKEIGESAEFFDALARKNPNALFALLGAPEKKPSEPSLFEGTVNTTSQVLGNGGVTTDRTYAYYEKIKKANPNEYWSPRVQNQMHKDALRLGPAFFN